MLLFLRARPINSSSTFTPPSILAKSIINGLRVVGRDSSTELKSGLLAKPAV